MEKKIDIAAILKNCPHGMELDCIIYNDVTLMDVDCSSYPIQVQTPEGNMNLSRYGCMSLSEHARCVIFPKGKTTWEGFVPPCQFKDGDIVYVKTCQQNEYITIFKEIADNHFYKYACLANQYFSIDKCAVCHLVSVDIMRLATEAETEKLFQAIKDRGYKWNAETKTLEKLIIPKFKVGDRIKHKILNFTHVITGIKDEYYIMDEVSLPHGILPIEEQNEYELVPDKFNINTLKPFDKVLVRDNDKMEWDISFFSHCNGLEFYKYSCLNGSGYAQCIPYEENKHLLGKTDDCSSFYKTWE